MPQSSLMTWLGKPAAVKEPPPNRLQENRVQAPEKSGATTSPPENEEHTPLDVDRNATEPQFSQRSSRIKLPANVKLRSPTKADIPSFKQINSLLLPIPYPESFYREILNEPIDHDLTLLALWHDDPATKETSKGQLVGALRCRLLSRPARPGTRREGPMLYLSTLVLLSPYRGHGIALALLDVLIRRAIEAYEISTVGAHVWEANEEGLAWYRKRGFKEVSREADYYRKLSPSGAVTMQREIGVMDLAG